MDQFVECLRHIKEDLLVIVHQVENIWEQLVASPILTESYSDLLKALHQIYPVQEKEDL